MNRTILPVILMLGCAGEDLELTTLEAGLELDSRAKGASKVTICHATSSATNPYTIVDVSSSSWTGGHGHGAHAGDYLLPTWYADTDGDGHGDPDSPYLGESCTAPEGYVEVPTDCDDLDPTTNPDEDEVCFDGVDNNCDGEVDEDCVDCDTQLLANSSFEEPDIAPAYYENFTTGEAVGAWTVGLSSVDIVGTYYGSYDGNQSVDMAGTPGPGSLYQTIDTVAGQDYSISFAVSSNGSAKSESLSLEWEGTEVLLVDSPAAGSWDTHTVIVTATGTSALVEFKGTYGGNQGALLDAIELYAECE